MPAQDLSVLANRLRADVLQMVFAAQAGHVAGPLSSADLFATLYFGEVVDLTQDKIILSCGHYCPIMYAALARSGGLPVSELMTFMQVGSRLPGHPERGSLPGIEASSGPLGQGVSVATGMALGLKMQHGQGPNCPRVYCILSDGELQEGQVWEAFTFAVHQQLSNLVFIVDQNNIQIEHYVGELATYGHLAGRFEAFGLHTLECDGHNFTQLKQVIKQAQRVRERPAMILMHTTAGRGVSFMENTPLWHDKVPKLEQLQVALQELGVADE